MKKKCFLVCAAAALTLGCAVSFAPINAQAQAEPQIQAVMAEDDAQIVYADYDYNAESDYEITTMSSSSNKTKTSGDWVKIILISVLISAVVTGITVFFIYRGYKHNGETEPYEYTKKAPLELTGQEDNLVDVRVTSRKINRD